MAEYLCVGGPADGQIVGLYPEQSVLEYAEMSKPSLYGLGSTHTPVEYRIHRYVRLPVYSHNSSRGKLLNVLVTEGSIVDRAFVDNWNFVAALMSPWVMQKPLNRTPGCCCTGELDYEGDGCIDGEWYGQCDDFCEGFCEPLGKCSCSCHTKPIESAPPKYVPNWDSPDHPNWANKMQLQWMPEPFKPFKPIILA